MIFGTGGLLAQISTKSDFDWAQFAAISPSDSDLATEPEALLASRSDVRRIQDFGKLILCCEPTLLAGRPGLSFVTSGNLTGLRTCRKYVDSVALVYLVNLDMRGDQRNLERRMENNMALTHNQSNSSEASISNAAGSLAALERHYSVADLAKLWLFSESTVRRIFIREPGVLKLVHEETRYQASVHLDQNP